jgi:hypothetical protein
MKASIIKIQSFKKSHRIQVLENCRGDFAVDGFHRVQGIVLDLYGFRFWHSNLTNNELDAV